MSRVRLIDLGAQRAALGDGIDRAISEVLAHGQFILGPEVSQLEGELARRAGVEHCVTCGNGTDAIVLALRALGVGSRDAVVVPAFTFAATAEAVAVVGATPILADVRADTFNIDPTSAAAAIGAARTLKLRPAALIAVDLFGQPADVDELQKLAAGEGIALVADAAQSFGARWRGRPVGSLAQVTTTSFFPSKPLGCYGDGGAVFTDDGAVAEKVRSLRAHGRGAHKYEHVDVGTNSRLDTIQAAILLQKLSIFDGEVDRRRQAADRYSDMLGGLLPGPSVAAGAEPVWAHYTVVVPNRDRVVQALATSGIDSAIYYPAALSQQPAYAGCPRADALAVSEGLATKVVSIPMHPYLGADEQVRVVEALRTELR